jgi:hypothetical protein
VSLPTDRTGSQTGEQTLRLFRRVRADLGDVDARWLTVSHEHLAVA